MSAPTKQEMLDTINTAINALSSGVESYSIGNRTVTHRDIEELKRMRKELMNEMSSTKDRTGYASFKDPA